MPLNKRPSLGSATSCDTPAADLPSGDHRAELAIEDDDIGCVNGDVGTRPHGDADIGRHQRRRVVDAVTDRATRGDSPIFS